MQAELERLATTDTLTGIHNRRAFDEQLALELIRARRYGNKLALILLDIDHFKRINDRHGHQTGDRVLVDLARVVGGRLRASKVFARWGGEEFVVLAPNTDAEDAAHLAEEIRARVEAHDFPQVGRVTVSLGVTQYAPDDTTDRLWKRADTALYRAKAGGRNRVEVELA
jgi:diguanylate cyclase (GGDEF)-like protein